MIGRLLRLLLLFTVLILLLRWLLSRQQRQGVHQFVKTLALALLLSSLLLAGLTLSGLRL